MKYLHLSNSSGPNSLVTQNWNVGMEISRPAYPLDVVGSGRFTSTLHF